jgi:uncharacterized damage-inducible protein DinB
MSEGKKLAQLSRAVRDSTLKRIRVVPAGSENWRPSPGAMSFADLIQHLIDADRWLFEKLRRRDLGPMVGRAGCFDSVDRDRYRTLIEALKQEGVRREELLEAMTDADLSELIHDERFGDQVSVWWVIVRGNLDHEAHHRGQIATYLRIVGR